MVKKKKNEIEKKLKLAEQYYIGKGMKKSFEKSLNIFRELADKYNNITAKKYLAEIYLSKGYIEDNYEIDLKKGSELAFNYYSELAEKYNDKDAKLFLAITFYYGEGYNGEEYEVDYDKAFNLFNDLIEKYDDITAKFFLAEMYYDGRGVHQDYKKVFNIINEIVEKYNNVNAENILAGMYYYGEYVQKSYNKVFDILKINDEHKIETHLAQIYYDGFEIEFLEKKYTLFNEYNKAFELFNDLAKKYNDVEAMKKIAEMYYYGFGVKENEEKSFQIYSQIAEEYKDVEAMREIAYK